MKEKKNVLLYYVNTDWGFLSHRLELAKKALSEGYEVHLMTNITDHKKFIENEGNGGQTKEYGKMASLLLGKVR